MVNPAHEPTEASRRTVKAMAAYGVPEEDIATVVEVSAKTLRKHYRRELDTGHIDANAKVAQRLYKIATEGDDRTAMPACAFWLKTRANWRETTNHEHTGNVQVVVQSFARLTEPTVIEGEVVEDGEA